MKKELIYVRVLQHDTADQVRIGASFPIFKEDINRTADNTKAQYDKDMEWCGGFEAGCEKYYLRIALVDADTLQSVKEIWKKGGK